MSIDTDTLTGTTAKIVAAFVGHNAIPPADVPGLIESTYAALEATQHEPESEPEYEPAVNPRGSVRRDSITSLIDGKPYKMLKRHLALNGLTPDQYRARFNLRPDYPMVAPAYSEKRRALAKQIGLGRHPQSRRGQQAKRA